MQLIIMQLIVRGVKNEQFCKVLFFFFYQNIGYNVQTNNLQLTKINQNNMIKMTQTINITLQPMKWRL